MMQVIVKARLAAELGVFLQQASPFRSKLTLFGPDFFSSPNLLRRWFGGLAQFAL